MNQHDNLRDNIGQAISDYAAEHMDHGGKVGIDWCSSRDIDPLADKIVKILQVGTPSSKWQVNGEPDPHAGHYDGERAKLCMGNLTDDEVANGAFMNYDQPLNLAGIMARTHASPIAWMTAVKERVRWLSRSLVKSEARVKELETKLAQVSK